MDMRTMTMLGCLMVPGLTLAANPLAEAPSIKPGDVWTYRLTTEKGPSGWNQTRDDMTVTRVTASSIYYTLKPSGSTQPPKELYSGADWSRSRDVNGKDTLTNRPLSFPLTPGKTWEIHFTEQHPNKIHRSEEFTTKYTVVGLESVQVPAGKFNAIKIEAEGQWVAQLEPTQSVVQGAQSNASGTVMTTETQKTADTTTTGRIYKAFWYVPEAGRWVKSVEEDYGSNGVRSSRLSAELESYTRAQ